MLTPITETIIKSNNSEYKIPYSPRREQTRLHFKLMKKRWSVLVCHRRFGKTVCMINHLLMSALKSTNNNTSFQFILSYQHYAPCMLGLTPAAIKPKRIYYNVIISCQKGIHT